MPSVGTHWLVQYAALEISWRRRSFVDQYPILRDKQKNGTCSLLENLDSESNRCISYYPKFSTFLRLYLCCSSAITSEAIRCKMSNWLHYEKNCIMCSPLCYVLGGAESWKTHCWKRFVNSTKEFMKGCSSWNNTEKIMRFWINFSIYVLIME